MSALRDNQGNPLTRNATVGRRALIWDDLQQAFSPPAIVREVAEDHLIVEFLDGQRWAVLPTEVMIPAVSQEMLEAGANALFLSYRRQADPEKTEQQLATAEKHARIVLEAAEEGRA